MQVQSGETKQTTCIVNTKPGCKQFLVFPHMLSHATYASVISNLESTALWAVLGGEEGGAGGERARLRAPCQAETPG